MVLQIIAGSSLDQQLASLQRHQNQLILRLRCIDGQPGSVAEKRVLLRQLRSIAAQVRVLDRQIVESQVG